MKKDGKMASVVFGTIVFVASNTASLFMKNPHFVFIKKDAEIPQIAVFFT